MGTSKTDELTKLALEDYVTKLRFRTRHRLPQRDYETDNTNFAVKKFHEHNKLGAQRRKQLRRDGEISCSGTASISRLHAKT